VIGAAHGWPDGAADPFVVGILLRFHRLLILVLVLGLRGQEAPRHTQHDPECNLSQFFIY
jgi:hypothetical protein